VRDDWQWPRRSACRGALRKTGGLARSRGRARPGFRFGHVDGMELLLHAGQDSSCLKGDGIFRRTNWWARWPKKKVFAGLTGGSGGYAPAGDHHDLIRLATPTFGAGGAPAEWIGRLRGRGRFHRISRSDVRAAPKKPGTQKKRCTSSAPVKKATNHSCQSPAALPFRGGGEPRGR